MSKTNTPVEQAQCPRGDEFQVVFVDDMGGENEGKTEKTRQAAEKRCASLRGRGYDAYYTEIGGEG